MAATKNEIRNWLDRGINREATHVIVVVETWNHTDFPVFVQPGEQVQDKIDTFDGKNERVMEVYNLSQNLDAQIEEYRAWNV